MKNFKQLAVAVLAAAGFSGCATTRSDVPATEAAAPNTMQVSRPAPSYGSMGGYRYRRFVIVTVTRPS